MFLNIISQLAPGQVYILKLSIAKLSKHTCYQLGTKVACHKVGAELSAVPA